MEEIEHGMSSMAGLINSGNATMGQVMYRHNDILRHIDNTRELLANMPQPKDQKVIDQINELLRLEVARTDCMLNGARGDRSQFSRGNDLYDDYQTKYYDLTQQYHITL